MGNQPGNSRSWGLLRGLALGEEGEIDSCQSDPKAALIFFFFFGGILHLVGRNGEVKGAKGVSPAGVTSSRVTGGSRARGPTRRRGMSPMRGQGRDAGQHAGMQGSAQGCCCGLRVSCRFRASEARG